MLHRNSTILTPFYWPCRLSQYNTLSYEAQQTGVPRSLTFFTTSAASTRHWRS